MRFKRTIPLTSAQKDFTSVANCENKIVCFLKLKHLLLRYKKIALFANVILIALKILFWKPYQFYLFRGLPYNTEEFWNDFDEIIALYVWSFIKERTWCQKPENLNVQGNIWHHDNINFKLCFNCHKLFHSGLLLTSLISYSYLDKNSIRFCLPLR